MNLVTILFIVLVLVDPAKMQKLERPNALATNNGAEDRCTADGQLCSDGSECCSGTCKSYPADWPKPKDCLPGKKSHPAWKIRCLGCSCCE